jgi:hypothetical protein
VAARRLWTGHWQTRRYSNNKNSPKLAGSPAIFFFQSLEVSVDANDEIISDIYEAAAVPAKTGVARQTELISLLAGKAPQPGRKTNPEDDGSVRFAPDAMRRRA